MEEKKINNSNETTNTAVSEKSEENIVKNNIEGNAEIEYNKNFSKSVFNKLNKETKIVIPIWAYRNYSEITINKNHEAFWNNQGNVVVVENGFYGTIFIKEDGTTESISLTKLDELTNQK